MKLTYNTSDKPGFGKLVVFAIQQLLAIMTATLVVPVITNGAITEAIAKGKISWQLAKPMSPSAALFGAGVGTLVYLFFTMRKSPVFLGSSFAFLGSLAAAFTGASSMALGYLGLLIGAFFAGLVYVIIALVVKVAGVEWINKLMPPVVIGPTVAIIGLSLAGSAVGDLQKSNGDGGNVLICVLCGIIALIVTMICSVYGNKTLKLIPFIIGILAGYFVALILTKIGEDTGNKNLVIMNLQPFTDIFGKGNITSESFFSMPEFTFTTAFGAFGEITGAYIAQIAVAYIPVSFVVFAEHIADHKNISSIIEKDLLEDPGLSRTLLGDGVGSIAGAFFGGCPNTTYGESIACVAITGNASVATIFAAAVGAIVISFLTPFVAFVNTIPSCVVGGVCMALYGFIAVSGLKMVQKVDLEDNKNLFVVSTILVSGIGGLTLTFGKVTITAVACALILGIIVNLVLSGKKSTK